MRERPKFPFCFTVVKGACAFASGAGSSWLLILLHSVLAFLILFFGIAYGLMIPSVFLVSLASAIHLWHDSMKEVGKIKWEEVLNYTHLYWRVESLFLIKAMFVLIVPYAILFWLSIYKQDSAMVFLADAIKANAGLIDLFIQWFPARESTTNFIIKYEGEYFLRKIYFICTCALLSLWLAGLFHLILFQPFNQLRARIDKGSLSKGMALVRVVILPILVAALFLHLMLEIKTDFFLQMQNGLVKFDKDYLYGSSLAMLSAPILPVLGAYVIQAYKRLAQ